MLIATKSGTNIILKISSPSSYTLERKLNTGSWEAWNGSGWGGSGISLTLVNFTDYDLSDGVYQYRYINIAPETVYSNCIVIGDGAVGWTFQNYTVPEGLFGEILTADDMEKTYLFGIDLTASNGQVWTTEQTQYKVLSATYQLEKTLNIDIFNREYFADDEENADIVESKFVIKESAYPNRKRTKYNIRSRKRPVRECTRLDLYSPTDDKILSLLQWLRLDKRMGNFRIYPKQGKLQSFTANSLPWINIIGTYDYRDAYHIDYKTGYGTADLIPEDLRDILGKITALKMLNIIGDGLLAGFSSSSINLDGLSESFSSTQGVENAYFGARIGVYADEIEAYIAENRNKYGNFRIGSF